MPQHFIEEKPVAEPVKEIVPVAPEPTPVVKEEPPKEPEPKKEEPETKPPEAPVVPAPSEDKKEGIFKRISCREGRSSGG